MGMFEGILSFPIAIVEFFVNLFSNVFGGFFGIFG